MRADISLEYERDVILDGANAAPIDDDILSESGETSNKVARVRADITLGYERDVILDGANAAPSDGDILSAPGEAPNKAAKVHGITLED